MHIVSLMSNRTHKTLITFYVHLFCIVLWRRTNVLGNKVANSGGGGGGGDVDIDNSSDGDERKREKNERSIHTKYTHRRRHHHHQQRYHRKNSCCIYDGYLYVQSYTRNEQWGLTAATHKHTMEYYENNSRSEERKIIEMSKRQLELSKHTAYDAHKHIHTQQSVLKTANTQKKQTKWIQSNNETVQFHLSRVFFSWCRFVAWWTLNARSTTLSRSPLLCTECNLCAFFSR